MGTMINVLLFVFGCGLIPMCLIRMNNDVSLITIIKLHIPCGVQIPGGKYRNCSGNTDFYFGYFCDDKGPKNVS